MVMGRAGQLDLLTITAIFVVVFALMYGGAQFSEGRLLPEDTTTEAEDDLRSAVWADIDERRDARGLDPMPRDAHVRGIAQDTTDTLVAELSANDPPSTLANATLSNTVLFCTQVPVSVPVENATAAPTNATAEQVADALVAADDHDVLFRPPSAYRAAMGIAVEKGHIYAVYRSCEQVDT
jgi:hypothetical protein